MTLILDFAKDLDALLVMTRMEVMKMVAEVRMLAMTMVLMIMVRMLMIMTMTLVTLTQLFYASPPEREQRSLKMMTLVLDFANDLGEMLALT